MKFSRSAILRSSTSAYEVFAPSPSLAAQSSSYLTIWMQSRGYAIAVSYTHLPIDDIPSTVVHYIQHEPERRAIADRTFALIRARLTLEDSIRSLLDAARGVMPALAMAVAVAM